MMVGAARLVQNEDVLEDGRNEKNLSLMANEEHTWQHGEINDQSPKIERTSDADKGLSGSCFRDPQSLSIADQTFSEHNYDVRDEKQPKTEEFLGEQARNGRTMLTKSTSSEPKKL